MSSKLLNLIMKDGSRNFAILPETIFFDELRELVKSFEGSKEIGFVTDGVTEVWLAFDFGGHKFSINNQFGDYWFFVDDPNCSNKILLEVVKYFEKFLIK